MGASARGMTDAMSSFMLQGLITQFQRIFGLSLIMAFATGCGDDVTLSQTPRPPSGPIDTARPPAAPENAASPDGPGATFAISKFRLGANEMSGGKTVQVWKTIGYNLDATVTTRTSAGVIVGDNVCAHVEGGTFNDVVDGDAGRDNRFGASVLPLMFAVNGEAETKSNDLIRLGKHTLLVDIAGLGDSPTYEGLTARIYTGRDFAGAQGTPSLPAFDGTDEWPIGGESVIDGSLEKALVLAQDAYLAEVGDGGTFVAQFEGSIAIMLDALGLPDDQGLLVLRVHDPLISMRLSADRTHVESGTLAGFIDAAEIDSEASRLLVNFVDNDCNSPTILAVRQQIRRSSDILRGGVVDPGKMCDSISIGIEFQATRAKLGSVVPAFVPQKNPCAVP